MSIYRVLVCALAFSIAAAAPVAAAEKKPAAKKAPPGRTETLACRLGTEDRHARIAVVVIRGRTDSFAYYSKWKPRTCSVYLQRNGDMYSKWADNGNITTVNLEKGAFLIEHRPGEYHFIFRDIDRERYCGMDGVINGSLTIKRGSDQCVLDGEHHGRRHTARAGARGTRSRRTAAGGGRFRRCARCDPRCVPGREGAATEARSG